MKILSIFVLEGNGEFILSAHQSSWLLFSSMKNRNEAYLSKSSTIQALEQTPYGKEKHIKNGNEHFYIKKSPCDDDERIYIFVTDKEVKAKNTKKTLFHRIANAACQLSISTENQGKKSGIHALEKIIKNPGFTTKSAPSITMNEKQRALKLHMSTTEKVILSHSKLPPINRETKIPPADSPTRKKFNLSKRAGGRNAFFSSFNSREQPPIGNTPFSPEYNLIK